MAGSNPDGLTITTLFSFSISEIMLSPLESYDGILVTAVIRNIGARKEESMRVERLKDDFVATVSHELRTPLTSITGSLALLLGDAAGKLPDPAARLLAIAHSNSQRAVRLINGILDVEKIKSGKVVFAVKRSRKRDRDSRYWMQSP